LLEYETRSLNIKKEKAATLFASYGAKTIKLAFDIWITRVKERKQFLTTKMIQHLQTLH